MKERDDVIRRLVDHFVDDLQTAFPELDRTGRTRNRLQQLVSDELTGEPALDGSATTRQVTILLSDLRGFTQLSEQHAPADVIGLLNRYLARMNRIIHDHGGVIDKFMGDAIMVLFGVQEAHDDDLLHAARCAATMQRAMDEINAANRNLDMPELFMGIGINTGEVVAGNVGSEVHSEFTVIGDQVNLASRVEAHSLRGQVLLSENSRRLLGDTIEVASTREVFIKGKRDPVSLYELGAVLIPERLEVPSREIRRGPRVDVDFPFRFQNVDGKSVAEEHHQGHAVDLSYGGLRGRIAFDPDRVSDLKLSLSSGMLDGEADEIYAKVLKVAPRAKGSFEIIMAFTSMPTEVERVIRRYVDRTVNNG